MIKVICAKCDKELKRQGALLFSPPRGEECEKTHLCFDCYDEILELINHPNSKEI